MRNLAKDIVEQGTIYEPPLVSADNGSFIVFDGNRRVTCLKLLADPSRAPTTQLQAFFVELRTQWSGPFPDKITCHVENDRDRLDSILFRRHTGSQNGVGQSTWDDRMKDNFVLRTGQGGGFNVADEIEQRLSAAGMLPKRRQLPRSTMNRLLSAEAFRNRLGFSVRKKKFEYTHNQEKVLSALARVAEDLATRKIVLGDLWDVDGKRTYLDQLDKEGVLPTVADALTSSGKPTPPSPGPKPPPKPKPGPPPKPTSRTTLIPQKEFGITWPGRLQRHHEIWEELQFRLNLSNHRNAISVLFRVLLEISIENYVSRQGTSVHQNDKLSLKVKKVSQHLFDDGKIDKKQLDATKKFGQIDQLVSADTLNRYVHSPDFAPSDKHLTAMWDSMAEFIVRCLET
ncbi:ParB N-terminal domain-containing protein [Actibacterium sp. D379-3]